MVVDLGITLFHCDIHIPGLCPFPLPTLASILCPFDMPSLDPAPASVPTRILIAGGSYAGLAAAVNLLDLSLGRPARFTPKQELRANGEKLEVEIRIVDERDGFCM